ncbi:MAG: hypothetical protein RR313_00205 [Anaerovoracaceae bacterium]
MYLTRDRELYNRLTYSKAYKQVGDMDNSVIRKEKWTPHNLRAICLGAAGAIGVYYTTNACNNNLMEPYVFKEGYVDPKDYQDSLKIKKGMIDALTVGLKFNYVEEIFFFPEGFTPDELEIEYERLSKFISNADTVKTFKRLQGIVVVEGGLDGLTDTLNPTKSLYPQLREQRNCKVLMQYSPERSALGLLVNQSLDSAEYALDKKYEDNLPEGERGKVEYRLSRYFYNEKCAAEKALRLKKEQDEEARKKAGEQANLLKKQYILELQKQGYKRIGNKEVLAGNDKLFTKVLNWLEQFCSEKPDATTGFKYRVCGIHESMLKSNGVMNVKDANIWSPNIFTKDEDLTFRLFVRENELSFSVLMKLPLDLDLFNFAGPNVNNIASIFSNNNSANGKVFRSSIIDYPCLKDLKGTKGIDCPYSVIEFALVKDLMDFAKSGWLFMDYLKACKGEQTCFSTFRNLPLGNRIVVGVKPNGLKIERFDSSGTAQTSGIICGKAGSGKSALMDSLVLQFMALEGNMGNGSVVLMDAKQELPALWRPVMQAHGIPYYGFDGGLIENQGCLQQQIVDKKGAVTLEGFSQPVTQEVGGMIFITTLFEVIQKILKLSGCKNIEMFNKSNLNIDGITRLPRIAIFVDEMNTFSTNSKNDPIAKSIINKITGGANLTRTAGFMWFLCGQDVPKSIISAEKRGSFGYNIMGTMSEERYAYFGVRENAEVVQYESKNATPEVPNPIMRQGTFYAGSVGKTEVIRSLYIPDDAVVMPNAEFDKTTSYKSQALSLIGSKFEGMFELDNIVRYALKNNLFDEYTYGVGRKNNIIFATLRDIGIITDSEFESATWHLFNQGEQGQAVSQNDMDADMDDYIDADYTEQTAGQAQWKPTGQSTAKPAGQPMGQSTTPPYRPTKPQPKYDTHSVQQTTVYNGNIKITENPFELYKGDSTQSTLLSLNAITRIIMNDIRKSLGDINLITSFLVTEAGELVFNGISYQPTFEESFLKTLPLTLREQVMSGRLVEMFDMRRIYDFVNLTSFIILSENLAQGRTRKEMGIGFRKRFSVLFNKFPYLNYIKVGTIEYKRSNPDTDVEQGYLDGFKRNPATTFASSAAGSRLDKVWDSKPVRVLTGALGWTLGVQAVWAAATLLGPIGLLFGAFAMAGAYTELKKPQGNQQTPLNKPSKDNSRPNNGNSRGNNGDSRPNRPNNSKTETGWGSAYNKGGNGRSKNNW